MVTLNAKNDDDLPKGAETKDLSSSNWAFETESQTRLQKNLNDYPIIDKDGDLL